MAPKTRRSDLQEPLHACAGIGYKRMPAVQVSPGLESQICSLSAANVNGRIVTISVNRVNEMLEPKSNGVEAESR